jgi:signal transduction histidine kinase
VALRPKAKIIYFESEVRRFAPLLEALQSDEYDLVRAEFREAGSVLAVREVAAVLMLVGDAPEEPLRLSRWIQDSPFFRHLPICFLTDVGRDPVLEAKIFESGAIDYLHQPLHPDPVRAKLAALVRFSSHLKPRSRTSAKETARLGQLLSNSRKELEKFASVCSHDLREPLRVVILMAQSLERYHSQKLGTDGAELVDLIVAGSKRLAERIDGVLDYVRVTGAESATEEVDLEEACADALRRLAPLVEKTGAYVDVGILPKVLGNQQHFGRLFQNLFANSLKFHGASPPKIRVEAKKNGRQVVVSVSDNGIGIDMQYAERLFGIFKRLHRAEEYPGAGIGLAICKRIVEHHGGEIWAESDPGNGATIRFTALAVPKKRKGLHLVEEAPLSRMAQEKTAERPMPPGGP